MGLRQKAKPQEKTGSPSLLSGHLSPVHPPPPAAPKTKTPRRESPFRRHAADQVLPEEAVWACRGSQASSCPRRAPAPHATPVLLHDTMSPPVWSISRAADVTVAEDHPTCFLWGEPKAKASLDHRRTSERVKGCKTWAACREDTKVPHVLQGCLQT